MKADLGFERNIPVLDWSPYLAQRTEQMAGSAIRELLKVTQQPDMISFAGGLPSPEGLPLRDIGGACRDVMRNEGEKALQ